MGVKAALSVPVLVLATGDEGGSMTLHIVLAISVVHDVLVEGLVDVGGARCQLTHLVWLKFVGQHIVLHVLCRQLRRVVVTGEAEGL